MSADGRLTVGLITLHVEWDEANRERFTADDCENCQAPLDDLTHVEVFMEPMAGGRYATVNVTCSQECCDQLVAAFKEKTDE